MIFNNVNNIFRRSHLRYDIETFAEESRVPRQPAAKSSNENKRSKTAIISIPVIETVSEETLHGITIAGNRANVTYRFLLFSIDSITILYDRYRFVASIS